MKRRRGWASTFIVLAVLVGCTSTSDPQDGQGNDGRAQDNQAQDTSRSGTTASAPDLAALDFLVPATSDVPPGFREIVAMCDQPFDDDKRPWYNIAVPSNWVVDGKIGGGTGSPISDSVELRFSTGIGRTAVTIEPDVIRSDRTGDANDGEGLDYESDTYNTGGTTSGSVAFDKATEVSIDGQVVDIFKAARGLYPSYRDVTQYKARINTMTAPQSRDGEIQTITKSVVVTVTPGEQVGQLPVDVVQGIIGSLAIPECTRGRVVMYQELQFDADLNEDGHIATTAELREALAGNTPNEQNLN